VGETLLGEAGLERLRVLAGEQADGSEGAGAPEGGPEAAVGGPDGADPAPALDEDRPGGDGEDEQQGEQELVEQARLHDQRGHARSDTGLQGNDEAEHHADSLRVLHS
jgi:hypothetical protein